MQPLRPAAGPDAPSGAPARLLSRQVVDCCAALAAATGLVVLAGWSWNLPALQSLFPGFATMKPLTAVLLSLSGAALWLLRDEMLQGWQRAVATAFALAVVIAGGLAALGDLARVDLRVAELFGALVAPGSAPTALRLSPATTACLLLVGLALLLIASRRVMAAQIAALVVAATAFSALVGYVYGLRSLYDFAPFASMALHTAIALVALAVGVLAARPGGGLVRFITSDSAGGVAARRVLPFAIGVPVLLGWLRLFGQQAGLYDAVVGSLLSAASTALVLGAVVWWASAVLHRLDERRQRAETEVLRYAHQLERSNQELASFAYVASHDLQEPLRTLAGFSELLSTRYRGRLDAQADEFLEFLVDAAGRMQTLVNDLLSYSRVGTRGEPFQPVDCNDLLGEAVRDLHNAIVETGALVVSEPLPTVPADGSQLSQVFRNLLGNAIKYRRPGVVPRVQVSTTRDDESWRFAVRDNGIGIDAQYFDRIFAIFQRLHGRQEYSGTGIGLAICKKVVERHGGRIWVESQPGAGSTFYFTLPERQESAP